MRYALGDAQRDVLDSVQKLGPCTVGQLVDDTGRVDVHRVVDSLVRRGKLIVYGRLRRLLDVPCSTAAYPRVRDGSGSGRCHDRVMPRRSVYFDNTLNEDCDGNSPPESDCCCP